MREFPEPTDILLSNKAVCRDSSLILSKFSMISLVTDSLLYIYDPWNNYCFTIYNLTNAHYARLGTIGQGPREIYNPGSKVSLINIDGTTYVSIFDNSTNRFQLYDVSDFSPYTTDRSLDILPNITVSEAFLVSDSIAVAEGDFEDNVFAIVRNGRLSTPFWSSLSNKGEKSIYRLINDANIFALSPGHDKIVRATQFGGLIEACSIKDSSVSPLFRHEYFPNDYDSQVGETGKTRYGYLSVTCNDEKIYGLYDGELAKRDKPFGSNLIHVYDWEGRLLEVLFTDTRISSIGITPNGKQLYAIEADTNDLIYFNHGN